MPIVLLLFAGMSETFFSHTTPCQCCRQMELGRPAYFLLATKPNMGPDEYRGQEQRSNTLMGTASGSRIDRGIPNIQDYFMGLA